MKRKVALAVLALAVMVVGGYFSRHELARAMDSMAEADPNWLWLAAVSFFAATVAAAGSWRCAVGLAGGETTLVDACARYGCGSFVNTFVPFRAGDAVRLALFSKLVPHRKRVRATVGSFAAIGAARAVVLVVLVGAGAIAGAVPLWPLAVLAGLVTLAVVAAWFARRHDDHGFLDAFRALAQDKQAAARLLAWMVASTIARYFAAAAICASLGIHGAFEAAIIILPALDLAMLIPVTPGNVGMTSGAIVVALKTHGVSFHDGLAAGIAFHAVETAVGLFFGAAGLIWLAPTLKLKERLTSAA